MSKYRRSKRVDCLSFLRQLLFVVGFLSFGLILSPQQASARSLTPISTSTEITLSPLEQNEELIQALTENAEEKQEEVNEQRLAVEELKSELDSIKDTKLTLKKEIEIMRAEIDELKAKKAAQEAREAREAELERQREVERQRQRTVTSSSFAGYLSSGNTYARGYCTWYVKNMRPDIPNGLGNANTWYSRASAMGMSVGSTPQAGAVGTTTSGALGHVVYVHSVNGDGTINISDMNYSGWNQVTYRTVNASEFLYIY